MKTTLTNDEPLTPGYCEWCGNVTELENTACSLTCEAQLRRLDAQQGRAVLRVLKKWRKHRGRKGTPGEGAMTETAVMVDRFLKNDRRRREEMQAQARAKAAAPPPEKKGKRVVAQTAAPVTNQPEDER